jgi:hypothetical protein
MNCSFVKWRVKGMITAADTLGLELLGEGEEVVGNIEPVFLQGLAIAASSQAHLGIVIFPTFCASIRRARTRFMENSVMPTLI